MPEPKRNFAMYCREIKTRVDLRGLLGTHGVALRGGRFSCLTPTHEDKNPSAAVTKDGAGWRCYGCGERGDVIDAAALLGGLDTVAAAEYLGKQAGLGDWAEWSGGQRKARLAVASVELARLSAGERESFHRLRNERFKGSADAAAVECVRAVVRQMCNTE